MALPEVEISNAGRPCIVSVGMHPLHALLLGAALAALIGTLVADIAYACTYQIQWSNFAAWLLVGGLLFAGLALVCAFLGLRRIRRTRFAGLHLLLWIATWVIALFNALNHARDAWGIMPGALVLSVAMVITALAATAVGLVPRTGAEP